MKPAFTGVRSLLQIPNRNWAQRTHGLTLIEVVIGMAILTITAMGVMAGLLHGRRIAESNLLDEAALVYAQSYLEDIKGGAYALFNTTSGTTVNTRSSTPLTNRVASQPRTIDFRGTTSTSDDMIIVLTPNVTKCDPVPTTFPAKPRPVEAYTVELTYRWRLNGSPVSAEQSRILRVIRSDFPSY